MFLAVFIPFAFISHRFSESVKHSPIGPLDRAAGVAFGVVRGLVSWAGLSGLHLFRAHHQASGLGDANARLLPVVQSTAHVLLSVVPDHPADFAYIPHHDELRQALAPNRAENRKFA